MLKKTIKYVDYNGTPRERTFYFNLSRAEVAELESSKSGGLSGYVERLQNTQDPTEAFQFFKMMILMSYGVKSDDGERFIKTQELRDSFEQSEAYSELLMEFVTSENPEKTVTDFMEGVLPKHR